VSEKATERQTVFLACPYGQIGGGMGSIMSYLADRGTDSAGRFDLQPLETRGGRSILLSPLYLAAAVGRMAGAAMRGRLGTVHINLAAGGSLYRKAVIQLAAKLLGGRVLLHFHAGRMIDFYEQLPALGKAIIRSMARSADHCVVLGDLWRHWLVSSLGVSPRAVSVVRNGVPATTLPRVPRPEGGPFRLLFVGNLLAGKGVTDLLHALALPDLRNASVTLTLAGGDAVDNYKTMAECLGIAERVNFLGWVSQAAVRRLLVESDALVLPSYHEGLPLVVLEALASAVPVICTPVGAVPEVLVDRETALFVPPGNRSAIASAVAALIRDPGLADTLARDGLALYEKTFAMDAFADAISAIYGMLAETSLRSADMPSPAARGVRAVDNHGSQG